MLHQILLNSQPPVALAILPGGKNWPLLSLSEGGRIYAGSQVIEATIGNVSVTQHLGNPDLLIELGQSASGGWWLTGSIEQTLLRSTDGSQWHKVSLPAELSSLISSYVANDNEIWLVCPMPRQTLTCWCIRTMLESIGAI